MNFNHSSTANKNKKMQPPIDNALPSLAVNCWLHLLIIIIMERIDLVLPLDLLGQVELM